MKKVLFFCNILLILILLGAVNVNLVTAYGKEEKSLNGAVDFVVDGGNMYLFDRSDDIIYIYSSRGEFRRAFYIENMGERLQTLRANELRNLKNN